MTDAKWEKTIRESLLRQSFALREEENRRLKEELEEMKKISAGWAAMAGSSDGQLHEALELLSEASTANFNSNLGARIKSFITKTTIENGKQ